MIIKVGLLLDSMRVPAWQQYLISCIRNNPSVSVELVVLNADKPNNASGNFVYKNLRRVDRKLFKARHDCFGRVELGPLLDGVEVLRATPVRARFSDRFSQQDVQTIKDKNLEVILRFGFRIIKGEILRAARLGVWSLHHGDSAVNRGGPPAFWEVVLGDPVSGVTLQILSEDLDGGVVIDKAFVRTDRTSFNRNQNAVYWAGIELFCNAINRLTTGTLALQAIRNPRVTQPVLYSGPLYRNPGNRQALRIFCSFWIRRLREVIPDLVKKPRWSLYAAFRNGSPETSLFRYEKLSSPARMDWADPFIVWAGDRYVVFFEVLPHRTKKGTICCLEFSDSGKLMSATPTNVLEEPHHLSYPFVFEHDTNWYMLPEAADCGKVWLYRCEKFPAVWKKHKLLLPDTALYDPTLILHEEKWYLFGTQKPVPGNSPDQYLFIYHTDDLLNGSWLPHAKNPVTRDVRGARPAGKIFWREGKLIRPGQIGAPNYGYGIRFYEIMRLTPEEFEERPLEDIRPHWKKGLRAAHTFNAVNGFSVVDAQGY